MRMFAANVVIALAFMLLGGLFTGAGLLAGLLLGAAILTLLPARPGSIRYGARLWRIALLLAAFLKEFTLSVFRVARLVLSPRIDISPGIFRFPLSVESDFEITLLANLITLTPGTLTVDVSQDRKWLFVHAIDCRDPDQARRDIADGFEHLIRKAFQ